MIYTIGKTSLYEKYFEEQDSPQKLGRGIDPYNNSYYCGGSVWKTREEAQANCPEDYSVYGVIADWEIDTAESEGNSWRDLLKTSLLVKLP